MSQGNLVIQNSGTLSGLALVNATNAAIDRLASLSSGTVDPASLSGGVQPFSYWMDTNTAPFTLRQRNAGNTAWLVVATGNGTAADLQAQTYSAFTTAGTSTAYTLAPTPALTALAPRQRFSVTFHAANTTTTPTLSISTLTAKAFKVYDSAGVKQNPAVGAFASGMVADVVDDGTDYVVLDALPPVTPAGKVAHFAMSTAPSGWLAADGSAVSRTTYETLFTAIGTTFGVGNGTTTFNIPDLRGEFIRGWDGGRGVDASRVFGSAQADLLKSHNHGLTWTTYGVLASGSDGSSFNSGVAVSVYTAASGGTETRPRNVAFLACIKF